MKATETRSFLYDLMARYKGLKDKETRWSKCKNELKDMEDEINKLQLENQELKDTIMQLESSIYDFTECAIDSLSHYGR